VRNSTFAIVLAIMLIGSVMGIYAAWTLGEKAVNRTDHPRATGTVPTK
jgi:disulfide bond formation protein DsbB